LFTDLLAFTGLTKRFADDPRLLLQIPNTYLQKVLRSIAICGGEVEKLVGDGLMATFGASGRQRVHPVRRRGAQARLEIYRMSLLSGPAYKASTHGLAA
jgi:class 3 adenylate cyclase